MIGQCSASRKVPSWRRKSRILSFDIQRPFFAATAMAVTAKDDGTTEFAIAITADEAAVGVCFAWPVIKDTRLALPSVRTISTETRFSTRRVIRALCSLVASGVVEVVGRASHHLPTSFAHNRAPIDAQSASPNC